MFDKEYYSEIIEKAIAEIDYGKGPRGLFLPVEYTLEGGGKRLRPMLLLATCEALAVSLRRQSTRRSVSRCSITSHCCMTM